MRRNCAMWITPWVDRDTEVIMDTSALTEQEWRVMVHNDPDAPPKDTVLVLVHPARYMDLKAGASPSSFMDFEDANGQRVAASLIDKHCCGDPELRRRLRWF